MGGGKEGGRGDPLRRRERSGEGEGVECDGMRRGGSWGAHSVRGRVACVGNGLRGGERKRPGKEVRDAQPGGGGGERGERKG